MCRTPPHHVLLTLSRKVHQPLFITKESRVMVPLPFTQSYLGSAVLETGLSANTYNDGRVRRLQGDSNGLLVLRVASGVPSPSLPDPGDPRNGCIAAPSCSVFPNLDVHSNGSQITSITSPFLRHPLIATSPGGEIFSASQGGPDDRVKVRPRPGRVYYRSGCGGAPM